MTSAKQSIIHHDEPLLIVISGPSGVGKDTVISQLAGRQMQFHFVVTTTSRPIRPGEKDGVDYVFVTNEEFERMIARDEFIEHALVYGEYKGIPKKQIQDAFDSRKDVVLRIDVQGAATIHARYPDAVLIFLTVQNEAELVRRLRTRKSDSAEKLELRIATAVQELQSVNEFDYVVENNDNHLDETIEIISAIINAEHHRVRMRKVVL